jgi:hypothetical protein
MRGASLKGLALMKATWKGATLAESDDTVVVEGNHYFPESSLKREYVTFSNHRSMCAWKGEAHYYSVMVDGELNPNAVWYYPAASRSGKACKSLESAGPYLPALKFVKMRVCTRRIACGTAFGGVMRALSSADRKIVLFSATSFFTNLSEAAFGLA